MAQPNNSKQEELLHRIAKLAKLNKDLLSDNEDLKNLVDKLTDENDKLKLSLKKIKTESTSTNDPTAIEKTKSFKFNLATVLFANIHGFKKLQEEIDSEGIMDELDTILFNFDQVIENYHVEKIKTIGDSYMCAGGIPDKNITNPIQVVLAALDMIQHLKELSNKGNHKQIWSVKFGIHTGPVTSSISGKKKISYDIKGDTVNIASRIESTNEPGTIIISEITYELVREFFQCEYWGKLPVKYKADLSLYEVKSIRPEFSVNGEGLKPSEAFYTKYGLIQFMDIQEIVLDKLEKELPEFLYYHNVKHTVDVVTQAELIGWAEGCSDEEILLLKTAALFHDAGHIIGYDNHEEHGIKLAREFLPGYNYTDDQIDKISEIIMATKLPPDPKNLLEKIICDSDLDYLGRSDFIPVSNTLYEELKAQNKIGSLNDWNKLQIKFLSNHQFFTNTAQSLREVNKQKQIDRIKSLIVEDE